MAHTSICIPDQAFKAYLVKCFDKNSDGEISTEEAKHITKINCKELEIKSLEGIEYFTNLVSLDCSFNFIKEINVSKNIKLEYLNCRENPILELNLRHLICLKTLYCGYCDLSNIDLTQNKVLELCSCRYNKQISCIDISQNTLLKELNVRECEIQILWLYNNLLLEKLD